MELLERYLHQVKRYLPKKDREDTLKELRSLILEELDSIQPNKEDEEATIKEIITRLGDPMTVAYQYRDDSPLLSRELEQIMWIVIKIPAIAIPILVIFSKTIGFIFREESFNTMDLLLMWAYTIPSILNIIIVSSGLIFASFILIQRYAGSDLNLKIYQFNPDILPPLPKKIFKVSVFEQLFITFGSVLFLYIINFNPGVIGVYYDGTSYPLLNEEFERILPFINLNIFFGLGIALYYLSKRRKNKISKTLEFVQKLFGAIIIMFLASNNIINDIILEGYNLAFIKNGFRVVLWFIAIFSIIGALTEFIQMFLFSSKEE